MPPRAIPFKTRLAAYVGLWLATLFVVAIFKGSNLLGMHQDLHEWLLVSVLVPIESVIGFATFVDSLFPMAWRNPVLAGMGSAVTHLGLCIAILSFRRPMVFYVLCGIQAVLIALSIYYFFTMSQGSAC